MTHPAEQIESEIIKAISEVMDKYYLKMNRSLGDEGYTYWLSQNSEHILDMNDINVQLLPKSYGKVKK